MSTLAPALLPTPAFANTRSVTYPAPRHERAAGKRRKPRHHHHYSWNTSWTSVYDQWSGGVACPQGRPADNMTVANKTLPCGTHVRFRYHGRKVTATVADRGPYACDATACREFDLSYEVRNAIGFGDLGWIDWRIVP